MAFLVSFCWTGFLGREWMISLHCSFLKRQTPIKCLLGFQLCLQCLLGQKPLRGCFLLSIALPDIDLSCFILSSSIKHCSYSSHLLPLFWLPRAGLSTSAILAFSDQHWFIVKWRPLHYRKFSVVPGISPLDAISTSFKFDKEKYFRGHKIHTQLWTTNTEFQSHSFGIYHQLSLVEMDFWILRDWLPTRL